MGIIITIIVIILVYAFFSKGIENTMDNMGLNDEQKESAWWTIGMMADIQNKNKDKK